MTNKFLLHTFSTIVMCFCLTSKGMQSDYNEKLFKITYSNNAKKVYLDGCELFSNSTSLEQIITLNETLRSKQLNFKNKLSNQLEDVSIITLFCLPIDPLTCGTFRRLLPQATQEYLRMFHYTNNIDVLRACIREKIKKLE